MNANTRQGLPPSRTQGAQANRTGRVLESVVQNAFAQQGFIVLPYEGYAAGGLLAGDYLLKHVPYTSIYGHPAKTEFLALSPARNMEIRIECKWQQVSGSVDEKFPYLFENCKNMPEPAVFILVDGGGYKPGALQWLKTAAAGYSGKDIRVFNMMEFTVWANTML